MEIRFRRTGCSCFEMELVLFNCCWWHISLTWSSSKSNCIRRENLVAICRLHRTPWSPNNSSGIYTDNDRSIIVNMWIHSPDIDVCSKWRNGQCHKWQGRIKYEKGLNLLAKLYPSFVRVFTNAWLMKLATHMVSTTYRDGMCSAHQKIPKRIRTIPVVRIRRVDQLWLPMHMHDLIVVHQKRWILKVERSRESTDWKGD